MSFASYPALLRSKAPANAGLLPALIVALGVAACSGGHQKTTPPGELGVGEGTVLDPTGRPVADVPLELGAQPADGRVPTATTRTTQAGTFRMQRVPPGRYLVRARPRAFATATAAVAAQAGTISRTTLRLQALVALDGRIQDGHGPADLVLAPARTLPGRVVDYRGAALPDATVRIDLIPATGLWPPLETDGAGAWTSPPLPPGKYQLRARRAGFTARRTSIVEITSDMPPGGPRM